MTRRSRNRGAAAHEPGMNGGVKTHYSSVARGGVGNSSFLTHLRSTARSLGPALRLFRRPRASREALVALQAQALRRIVRHADEHVPYYRRAFEAAGCRPQDVRSVEDLAGLPITTKEQLRTVPREDRLARGTSGKGVIRHLTSGFSGQPLEVWRSNSEETLLALYRIRAVRQSGIRARDRIASIHEPRQGEQRTPLGRLARSGRLLRSEAVDCTQPAERIAAQLEAIDPDVVVGYPSALAFIAPIVARRSPARIRPRLLHAGGESLPLATRRLIEEGFDARLFESYGTTECNFAAWECPELGFLHVCDDSVVVEVLRDGAPVGEGETGEVVLTCLHSYTMPFIRFSLGDLAVRGPEPCPCGQPFSTIRSVQGRVADYFHLPGGRSIHPFAITDPLLHEDWRWVGQHQMEQEDRDRIVLRISPLREPLPSELDRIQRRGGETVGAGAHFRIELVDSFPLGPGGKFQTYRPLAGDESG